MENLRLIREAKRMTQVHLSVEIGVAQETISAYESGKAMPSMETLCKMVDFLNTSTDYLLDRTSVKTPINSLSLEGLTAEEIEVISHFKVLSKDQKNKVLGFMMGMLE